MLARQLLSVIAVTCVVASGAPALAGAPDASHRVDRSTSDRSQTSDGEPGQIARPLTSGPRVAARTSNRSISRVAPGVTYTRWRQTDERGPVRAHLLTIDPSEPGLAIDYASVGSVRRTATVPRILAADRAVAGVNGDFYDIGETGAPLGLGIDRQRGLLHGRTSGWNSAFYLDKDGHPGIGTLALQARIVQHPELLVTNLNSHFVAPGGIGVYAPRWGRTAGYRVTQGQRHQVRMVVVRKGRVQSSRKKLTSRKPVRGLVLIGRGAGAKSLRRLSVGSRVTVRRHVEGRPRMAITGDRFLVNDGLITVVDDKVLHPRTAVGIDDETGQVLLLVIDGRTKRSRGFTMVELANLMVDLGADEALNLDGGGSSTMVAVRPERGTQVVNRPPGGALRKVSNALQITYKAP